MPIGVTESQDKHEPAWDEFLRNAPTGQYQQSSLWAEFKAIEGWQPHRVILTGETGIVGGFQILWKSKWGLKIGYLSKGPVAHPHTRKSASHLAGLITQAVRQLKLVALIMQAPDESPVEQTEYLTAGFLQSNPMKLIEATCLIALDQDIETLRHRMSRSLQRNLRAASKHPATLREGSENDMGTFFSLMSAICQRKGVTPNPSNENSLRLLWRIFHRGKNIRVSLAEYDGRAVAAMLCLGFGDRLTLWKKGWDGSNKQYHPNKFLHFEALEWARAQGYKWGDFCSFDRVAAENILREGSDARVPCSSRDDYHLSFGGYPKLLPKALLFIPNRLLRWVYLQFYQRFVLRKA